MRFQSDLDNLTDAPLSYGGARRKGASWSRVVVEDTEGVT